MVQHGLIVLNTRFRKSKKKLWTFMYTNGEKALNLTTHLIPSAPITESFPVKSTSATDKANLLEKVR